MSNAYLRALSHVPTQREQALPNQVANNAGGFVFGVDDKTRLERFLILGTTGGTYYVNEQDLTKQNMQFLIDMIARDEVMVWNTIKEVSQSGRAYRNSPTIFTLALLFRHGKLKDGPQTIEVHSADKLVPIICRTATHLYELQSYAKALKVTGRAFRRAIAAWYTSKSPSQLAYQAVKYRQRDGWTHRDGMRLSHPCGVDSVIGNFILGKEGLVVDGRSELDVLRAFVSVQGQSNADYVLNILCQDWARGLPWEGLPTGVLKDPRIWQQLFYNGQLSGQALVRNITRLARIGAFDSMVFAREYADRLTDDDMIKRTRLHPIQYLLASIVHTTGQVDRSRNGFMTIRNKDWTTSSIISNALQEGFYKAFKYVEPANKRTMISLDVSGSMAAPAMGIDLSCAELGAAMIMSIARTEPYYVVNCFATDLNPLDIAPHMGFEQVMQKVAEQSFVATDCAAPMLHAIQRKIEVDTFVIFTDNETWRGKVHPYQALRTYRDKMGINARLIVAAAASTEFSIADPTDAGMLDICGADANLPRLVSEFSAGRL